MIKSSFFPIPTVVERTPHGERGFDIFSRLLRERIVFVTGQIDDSVANLVMAQMMFLEAEDPEKDIFLYINSPGGIVTSGMAIYDTMQFIQPQVNTLCIGQASSMGAFLLASGAKGKRSCLPHSRIMLHQPIGGFYGQATDVEIHAKEILKAKQGISQLIAKHTDKPVEVIRKDIERDCFFSAQEAKQYKLIDSILYSRT